MLIKEAYITKALCTLSKYHTQEMSIELFDEMATMIYTLVHLIARTTNSDTITAILTDYLDWLEEEVA